MVGGRLFIAGYLYVGLEPGKHLGWEVVKGLQIFRLIEVLALSAPVEEALYSKGRDAQVDKADAIECIGIEIEKGCGARYRRIQPICSQSKAVFAGFIGQICLV
jgi:hypothetical protein